MPNNIMYDYLSITSKIHDVMQITELIGMVNVPWESGTGAHGFNFRLYYDCISVFYGHPDGIVWLEMTGQGCRAFESFGNGDYDSIFKLVIENPLTMNITRLDVAFDDKSGILDIKRIAKDVEKENFVSRFQKWEIKNSSEGVSIYHGSQQSEILIRIYDKAAERGFDDNTHWIRVELQIRRDRALQFISDDLDISLKFKGVLINYLRYLKPDKKDTNKRRWQTVKYWDDLINKALPISLYVKPGVDYNMKNLSNFVYRQAGNAVDTAIQIFGIDTFMKNLDARDVRENPKYKRLIDQHEQWLKHCEEIKKREA